MAPLPSPIPQLPTDVEPPSQVASGKFIVDPVDAVGIAFTPEPGNVGGYPLEVTVNDDTKRKHIVRGSQFLHGDFQGAKLEINAAPAGSGAPGVDGDVWHVTLLPSSQIRETPRPRQDSDGFLVTRSAGDRPLFDFSTRVDRVPFVNAFKDGAAGLFYITPNDPQAFTPYDGSSGVTRAWPLGRFSRAAFYIDQSSLSGIGLAWSVIPFVELTHSVDGRAVATLQAGSVGEFGNNSATPWNAEQGHIILGAAPTATDTHTHEEALLPSYARFGLLIDANLVDWEGVFPPPGLIDFDLRFKGIAW